MKIPTNFNIKCPNLEQIGYHSLRMFGILIGMAIIVCFIYDQGTYEFEQKLEPERLYARKSESLFHKKEIILKKN